LVLLRNRSWRTKSQTKSRTNPGQNPVKNRPGCPNDEDRKINRKYAGDPEADLPDHNRAAVLLGINIMFGRFSFIYQWGIYYYEPYPARNRAYQRYGLNFRFSRRLYTGVNIKVHGHVADLMDLRLGFIF